MTTLHDLINKLNLTSIKELLVYLPDPVPLARKDVLVSLILQRMAGKGWLNAWERLDPCQRLAVGEAAHHPQGDFEASKFAAKYGKAPAFTQQDPKKSHITSVLTPLCLFLYELDGEIALPRDLHADLKAFTPKPALNTLASHARAPQVDEDSKPLTIRATAAEALHDVVAMLRAVDQGLIAVSDRPVCLAWRHSWRTGPAPKTAPCGASISRKRLRPLNAAPRRRRCWRSCKSATASRCPPRSRASCALAPGKAKP